LEKDTVVAVKNNVMSQSLGQFSQLNFPFFLYFLQHLVFLLAMCMSIEP